MSDKKALQAGTSHYLGQNFAKAFEIQFQNKNGEMEFAYTTSWGVSTRLIGALIMTHSDNDGLVLPPRIAPTKAVIVPISTDDAKLEQTIVPKAKELQAELNKVLGGRFTQIDTQFHIRPGDRFFYHLQKGVPLRLELGEKEYAAEKLRVVRRDTGEKIDIAWSDAPTAIPALLEEIQQALLEKARAFRFANTHRVETLEQFKEILEKEGGFVDVYFSGTKEDEKAIKDATGATPRCYPTEWNGDTGKCFYTGKEGARRAIFAKSY